MRSRIVEALRNADVSICEDISAALNAGMNGHIAKPVDTAALYRLLKKSMEETE